MHDALEVKEVAMVELQLLQIDDDDNVVVVVALKLAVDVAWISTFSSVALKTMAWWKKKRMLMMTAMMQTTKHDHYFHLPMSLRLWIQVPLWVMMVV